jgi:hypothetical protein
MISYFFFVTVLDLTDETHKRLDWNFKLWKELLFIKQMRCHCNKFIIISKLSKLEYIEILSFT